MSSTIGIGGCSRSGKTTLAELLSWHYRTNNQRVIVLHQDDFVKKISDIPLVKDRTDWDTPLSIDFDFLLDSIAFFYKKCDVLIVEGLYTFYDPRLVVVYRHRIFCEISEKTFLERRTAETRWGREPDWFVRHVWDSFQKYGQPETDDNLRIVSGEEEFDLKKILRLY